MLFLLLSWWRTFVKTIDTHHFSINSFCDACEILIEFDVLSRFKLHLLGWHISLAIYKTLITLVRVRFIQQLRTDGACWCFDDMKWHRRHSNKHVINADQSYIGCIWTLLPTWWNQLLWSRLQALLLTENIVVGSLMIGSKGDCLSRSIRKVKKKQPIIVCNSVWWPQILSKQLSQIFKIYIYVKNWYS